MNIFLKKLIKLATYSIIL